MHFQNELLSLIVRDTTKKVSLNEMYVTQQNFDKFLINFPGNDVDKKEQEVKTPPKPKEEKKVKKPKPENPAPEKKEEVKAEVKKPEVKKPEAKPEVKKPEKKPEVNYFSFLQIRYLLVHLCTIF